MNTVFRKTTLSLALAACFTSCQTDNLISPDKPEGTGTAATNNIIPTDPQKFILVKDGAQTISYYGDGRLKRTIYGADVPGNLNERMDYTYDGSKSVKATYAYDNKVHSEETYLLDANGRCFQYRAYVYPDGGVTKVKYVRNASYTYDLYGRLKTWTYYGEGTSPTLLFEYTYNADGDLSKVVRNDDGSPVEEFTFLYTLPDATALLPDTYPLNAQLNFQYWGQLADTYLAVFGNASKHLVKRISRKNLLTNQIEQDSKFSYTMDPNGYVTNRTSVNLLTGLVKESRAYEYVNPNVLPTF